MKLVYVCWGYAASQKDCTQKSMAPNGTLARHWHPALASKGFSSQITDPIISKHIHTSKKKPVSSIICNGVLLLPWRIPGRRPESVRPSPSGPPEASLLRGASVPGRAQVSMAALAWRWTEICSSLWTFNWGKEVCCAVYVCDTFFVGGDQDKWEMAQKVRVNLRAAVNKTEGQQASTKKCVSFGWGKVDLIRLFFLFFL